MRLPYLFPRLLLAVSIAALSLTACGANDKTTPSTPDAGAMPDAMPDEDDRASFEPALACDDKPEDLYGDPGALPDEQGAILRCVDDGIITKESLAKRLAALKSDSRTGLAGAENPDGVLNTYQGPPPKQDSHAYRVLYRTERGNGLPGYAVASIYAPAKAAGARSPLMLIARGSRGQAPGCAPSRYTDGPIDGSDNTDGRVIQDDLEPMLWPLVASGFAVALTDSAGYANYGAEGNPPSGYSDVQDMAKSFLDSGHALKKLLPNGTTDSVLMVGLSQGGHTVLSSLQMANEYEPPGTLAGAAVYSPLWFAQRAWGVVLSPIAASIGGIVLNKSSALNVAIWYHYTQAELYDGPGEGVKLFKPEVQATIKDFVDTTCWSSEYVKLAEGGRSVAADFFTDELIEAVGQSALDGSCDESPNKPLCEKWMERYRDDHPVLSGKALEVPILVAYGLKDDAISPARFQCAVDKLEKSVTDLSFCIDPEANHAGIILTQSEYVNQWLRNEAYGSGLSATCPSNEAPTGLECDPLLPNDP